MATNQPLSKLLNYKRVQLTPNQLAAMQEFRQTINDIEQDNYRGDKYKVYKNYQRRADSQVSPQPEL